MREKCHDMSGVFLADPKGWWNISLAENVLVSNNTFKMSFQPTGKDNLSIYWYPAPEIVFKVLICCFFFVCFFPSLTLLCFFFFLLRFLAFQEKITSAPSIAHLPSVFNKPVSQLELQYPGCIIVFVLDTLHGSHTALAQDWIHRNEQNHKTNCLHDTMTI